MKYHTMLFDLDDTLHSRKKAIEKFGVKLLNRYQDTLSFEAREKLPAAWAELDCQGYSPRETVFQGLIERICWENPPSIPELISFYESDFPSCSSIFPETMSLLRYLREHQIKLGIVTNGADAFQNEKIDTLHLRDKVDGIIVSDHYGYRKPAPELFEIALSLFSAKREETLFIGDYAYTDILGAYRTNIDSAWLSDGKQWTETDFSPTYVLTELWDLKQFVNE